MTECAICLECLNLPVKLNCNHSFCYECIIKCDNNLCPLCRNVVINKNDIENCCKCSVNIKVPFQCTQYTRKGNCRLCKKKSLKYFKNNYFKSKLGNIEKNNYSNCIYNTLV